MSPTMKLRVTRYMPTAASSTMRLVGHHLDQLALGADEAVGGAGLVGAQDEEDARQGQGEDDEQQVPAGEEQRRR